MINIDISLSENREKNVGSLHCVISLRSSVWFSRLHPWNPISWFFLLGLAFEIIEMHMNLVNFMIKLGVCGI